MSYQEISNTVVIPMGNGEVAFITCQQQVICQ
jgi:hypothetical protein